MFVLKSQKYYEKGKEKYHFPKQDLTNLINRHYASLYIVLFKITFPNQKTLRIYLFIYLFYFLFLLINSHGGCGRKKEYSIL